MDDADAADRPNVAFVSSTQQTAALGGVAGADARCRDLASAAGLPGEFIAFLQASDGEARARLAGSRGWVDRRGVAIADAPEDFFGDGLIHPLRIDERGQERSRGVSYVARDASSRSSCAGWTDGSSGIGYSSFVDDDLVDRWQRNCSAAAHIICLEIGHDAPVTPPPMAGRVAFTTVAPWLPSGGLAAADAACAADAATAGLGGSFKALLPTSSATAGSRFSASGGPWRTVGGPAITSTATEFIGSPMAPSLETFLNRDARGVALTPGLIWLGNSTANCSNWNSTLTTAPAGLGESTIDTRLAAWGTFPCDATAHVLCLEE